MSKVKKRLVIVISILFLLFWLFYFFNQEYFQLEFLFDNLTYIQNYISNNYIHSFISFVFIYCLLIIFNFPFASLLSMTGGFLFGTLYGGMGIILGGTLGSFVVFLIAKFFFLNFVKTKILSKYTFVSDYFHKNDLELMLLIRLIPAVPFFAQNLILSGLGAQNFKFFYTTLIGLTPWAFIFASIGQGLQEIFIMNVPISFSLIAQPKYLLPLIVMVILILSVIFFKKKFKR